MDELFDKLDKQVEAALGSLFPSTEGPSVTTSDAQHRAQEFSNQVALIHTQLVELKSKIEEPPTTGSSPLAVLEREIADLRQDIDAKNDVLEKHRATLARFSERLDETDKENRNAIEGSN
ncbi:hypothetical protein IW140_002795 [Coemansia sp. RSA 1813]|nr:hypothetical protein EV178_005459 [Coemansia sp. RSA 1646]KAJ1770276.1 hypothetical protein LPJ74_003337 [Coemansia sp. RSA 1843]KAJ2087537.1 hypothetical protein IW138_004907 [Coemansia sp. RSA 986]KAJ2211497.1 hypothetical protein EV179_005440 [Coemansia sp. RSA 487]KAJ2569907.1 hypothetical protein IW140_002795 [Coemansia sp. RSA 1813]